MPSEAYRKAFDAKAMSNRAIAEEARKLLKHPKITLAITLATQSVVKQPTVLPALPPAVRVAMETRLERLEHAINLDPLECFDALNHFMPIREMPQHVRRAIAGFKVDPVSFITEVKFVDRISAIRLYSQLSGDIPREKGPVSPPSRSRFDLTKLTDEELREHMRLRRKAMVEDEAPR